MSLYYAVVMQAYHCSLLDCVAGKVRMLEYAMKKVISDLQPST